MFFLLFMIFFREDFTKVFDVVREQIEKALLTKHNGGPKTFEEFKNRVSFFYRYLLHSFLSSLNLTPNQNLAIISRILK